MNCVVSGIFRCITAMLRWMNVAVAAFGSIRCPLARASSAREEGGISLPSVGLSRRTAGGLHCMTEAVPALGSIRCPLARASPARCHQHEGGIGLPSVGLFRRTAEVLHYMEAAVPAGDRSFRPLAEASFARGRCERSSGFAAGHAMAEREGFEPPIPFERYTHFPGARLRPLGHLSCCSHGCGHRPPFKGGQITKRSFGPPAFRASAGLAGQAVRTVHVKPTSTPHGSVSPFAGPPPPLPVPARTGT